MGRIIRTDEQWGKKPHAENVQASFDPYGEHDPDWREANTQCKLMNRAQLIKTVEGPKWATPIYVNKVDPATQKKQRIRQYMFWSPKCPIIVQYLDPNTNEPTKEGQGIPISKHKHPRPCLATEGCTAFESDPVNPDKIYRTPEGFYMSQIYFNYYEARRLHLCKNLRIVCFGCVKDHINAMIEKDPTKFVDLGNS